MRKLKHIVKEYFENSKRVPRWYRGTTYHKMKKEFSSFFEELRNLVLDYVDLSVDKKPLVDFNSYWPEKMIVGSDFDINLIEQEELILFKVKFLENKYKDILIECYNVFIEDETIMNYVDLNNFYCILFLDRENLSLWIDRFIKKRCNYLMYNKSKFVKNHAVIKKKEVKIKTNFKYGKSKRREKSYYSRYRDSNDYNRAKLKEQMLNEMECI